jgi:predicted membrane-bound spermidine synthase
MLFPLLAFLSGFLGGYQFPLVSRLYYPTRDCRRSNPGIIYGLDILGAWCASLLISLVFFPLYGLVASALLIAVVNTGPILLAATAAKRR